MAGRAHLKHRSKAADDAHSRPAPTVFTCPDCQGTLFLLRDHNLVRFRCRIGHLYSPESMLDGQTENVERLMWSAARALEEQSEYTSQMAGQISRTSAALAKEYRALSHSAHQKAEVMRKLIMEEPKPRASAHTRTKSAEMRGK